jgi:hypothetical protein
MERGVWACPSPLLVPPGAGASVPPGWSCTASTDEAEEIPGQDLTVEAGRRVVDGATYVGDPSSDLV